jgi:ribosomal protein S18 acetylase RimI-like enzyme
MISYRTGLEGITSDLLAGFFVRWPNPPSPETHLRMLRQSYRVVLAIDDQANKVVGFINAIGDGVLSAYIPLLEVLPEYQMQGIGDELVQRMLKLLDNLYMIDLTCDRRLQKFYERFGLKPYTSMISRNFAHQSGS